MIPGPRKPQPEKANQISFFLFLLASLLFLSLSTPVGALTEVELSPVPSPDGAVFLIVDGLSAPFVYPELTPRALDGNPLEKALLTTLPEIAGESARVLDIRAPQTFTEGGHSVLVTGNRKADSELVSFKDASLFDAAHKNGYLCLGVMERGDSWAICAEQDAILRDKNNSLKNLKISLEEYEHPPKTVKVPPELIKLMKEAGAQAPTYTASKETRERYSGYNRWGIDTACKIVEYMAEKLPDQKYILTVNVGAVDLSGHYRKNYGYIDCIEKLDTDLLPLYELCKKHNLVFILTSDHGMAFPTPDSRGGHQAEKYAVSDEAQMLPLLVQAPGIKVGVLEGKYGQEDIAPTILSLLNIPERPRFSEGEVIFEKDYANLKVIMREKDTIKLLVRENEAGRRRKGSGSKSKIGIEESESETVLNSWKELASTRVDNEFLFLGLEPDQSYKIVGAEGASLPENEFFLKGDLVLDFTQMLPAASQTLEKKEAEFEAFETFNDSTSPFSLPQSLGSKSNFKRFAGYILIGLINFGGLVLIARILKE